jgi:alkylation response protein AidB-like acyl-CoA dehydrogenase
MDLALSTAQQAALDDARAVVREVVAPNAARNDAEARFPTENMQALAARGLLGVRIPEEFGGRGADKVAYAVVVREIASACAGTAVGAMVSNMVAEAVLNFGNTDQQQRFLPPLMRGEWPSGSFCLSEPGSGSDAASLTATARRDGDHYVLDGTKSWVTSGGHSGFYLVMARTDPGATSKSRGISAFVIPADAPGLTATKPEEKMGLRASKTTQIVLEGCRVPVENRLGEEGEGFKVAMGALDGGRIGVSAQALGVGFSALELAARAVAADPLAQRAQGATFPLADAATELEAGWLLCLRAASMKDRGQRVTREASMAKMFCTEAAWRACNTAVEVVGTAGLEPDMGIERRLRDVRVTRIYEGTNEVQRVVVSREVVRGAMA